ncbi:MAG: O-antigen ligase family protein [Smithellaceae bacterium]
MISINNRLLVRSYIILLMLSLAIDVRMVFFIGLIFCGIYYREFLCFLRERKIVLLMMGLFLLSGILSALFSPYSALLGLKATCHYAGFISIACLLLFLFSIAGEKAGLFYLKVLVGLALFLALIAFGEVVSENISRFLADLFRNGERAMISGRVRAGATLHHANVFGCFMSLGILILIYLKDAVGLKAKLFYPVATILAAGMALSASRNAVFVLALPLLMLLLNRKTVKTVALMMVIALIALAILTPSTARFSDIWKISARTNTSVSVVERGEDRRFNTASTRLWLWQSALAMFYDHPLTGVGPGSSSRAMKDYASAPLLAVEKEKIEKMYLNAHNGFLNILAEFGLVGSAVALAFALYLAVLLIRRYDVFPPAPVHAILSGIVLSFIPDAFLYSIFYMSIVLTLFLLFAFPAKTGSALSIAPDQPASREKG